MTATGMTAADVYRAWKERDSKVGYEMVRRYSLGYAMPRQERIAVLAEILGTTPAYLQHGEGASVYQNGATAEEEKFDVNVAPASMGTHRVPLLNYVQAGMFTEMGSNFSFEGMEYLLVDAALSHRSFALQIKGDSMKAPPNTPGDSFAEGDRVIIDCEVHPRPGDYVVAKNGGEEATFKKYRLAAFDEKGREVFELVPLNPDYPTLRSDQHHIEIIGTMVEYRKYYRR